jgi:hypothetical protein
MALSAADLPGIFDAIKSLRRLIESENFAGELEPARWDLARKLHPSDAGRMVAVSTDIEECELGPIIREALRDLWYFVINPFGTYKALRHKRIALDLLERIEAALKPGKPDWACTAAGFHFGSEIKLLSGVNLRLLEAFVNADGMRLTKEQIIAAAGNEYVAREPKAYVSDLNRVLRDRLRLVDNPVRRISKGVYQFFPPATV